MSADSAREAWVQFQQWLGLRTPPPPAPVVSIPSSFFWSQKGYFGGLLSSHSSNSALPQLKKMLRTQPETFTERLQVALQDANPLNIFLSCIAIYLFYSLIRPHSIKKLTPTLARARSSKCNANNSYSFLPDQHPPSTVWTRFTPRTLAVHDGSGIHTQQHQQENGAGTPDGNSSAASHGSSNIAVRSKGKGKAKDSNDARILLAIQGKVFDVTKGANFYGPGGPYGNFAGRDASRGMAKQSFDLEMLTPLDKPLDSLNDLTPMEVNNMREWLAHFSSKYTIVGELVNEGEEGDA